MKNLSILVSVSLVSILMLASCMAGEWSREATFEDSGLIYGWTEPTESGKWALQVCGLAGAPADGIVRVPQTVKYQGVEYPVIAVSRVAFSGDALVRDIRIISLPSTIETIGAYAFARCENLEEIFVPAQIPPVADESAFSEKQFDTVTLRVVGNLYQQAPVWSKFHKTVMSL